VRNLLADSAASDEIYFDPTTAKRIDGQDALKQYFAPFTGKIKIEKVEMIDPRVQRSGDHAIAEGFGDKPWWRVAPTCTSFEECFWTGPAVHYVAM
jgi:hypothetical protein